MPSAIWTGSISFGLVTVPVRLVSATRSQDVRFHQLEAETGARIRYRRVSEQTGEEVQNDQIVKGYELENGHYVVLEGDELAALKPKASRQIEIEDFVELSQIDPVFYDHPYYLAPGPGGAKPYRLLLEAMRETGKVAIARVVIRSKEQLVALRPMGDVLGMATMIFADEILPAERLDEITEAGEVKTTKRELDIAKQLVDSLAGEFEPDRYSDTYRADVIALIERKAQGETIAVQPTAEEVAAPAPDLMSALKASLDAVRAREEEGTAKKRGTPAKKAAAKKPAAAKKATGARGGAKKSAPSRTSAKR